MDFQKNYRASLYYNRSITAENHGINNALVHHTKSAVVVVILYCSP